MSDPATTPEGSATHDDPADEPPDGSFWPRFLDHIDAIPYVIVGAIFWLAALLSLAYGLTAFIVQVQSQFQLADSFPQLLIIQGQGAQDVITLVSDLLLTLIIMEVFGTVIHYLRERETTLKPFLFIGIISATRGILSIGARLAVGSIPPDEFVRDMVELGVDGAVIIALAVAMKLIGNLLDQGATSSRGRQHNDGRPRAATSPARPSASSAMTWPSGWAKWAVVVLIVLIVAVSLTLLATILGILRL